MNIKIITLVIAAIIIAVAGIQIGAYLQNNQNAYIDPDIQGNAAAQEIAELGIPVYYQELGEDGNGYTVNGQTQIYQNGTVACIILDDDIDPNSYEAHAILYHELGHAIHQINGEPDNEQLADEYAANKGYQIQDAYHGIH